MGHALLAKRFNIVQLLLLTVGLTVAFVYIDLVRDRELVIEGLINSNAPQPGITLAEDGPPSDTAYRQQYEFTEDWFTPHIPSWRIATMPWAGKPEVRYLEVGVYEGRAAMWAAENILTHESSELVAVDLFAGGYVDEYGPYERRYRDNLARTGLGDRATTIRGYSQIELRKLPLDHYDIIYVDGSHQNPDVLEDAILVWRLLKDGGLLIFDDYNAAGFTDPRIGIDTFMRFYGEHFEVVHNGYQLMLKKKVATA